MLRVGEKVVYETQNGFNLSTINKLAIGEKNLYITNLGNILIEDKSNFFKKGETNYYYNYSENKKKLSIDTEKECLVLKGENLLFKVISENNNDSLLCDISIKLTFEELLHIYNNQREFIIDIGRNKSIFKLENGDIKISRINRYEGKIVIEWDRQCLDIYLEDIEKIIIDKSEVYIDGYFYSNKSDDILKSMYFFLTDVDYVFHGVKEIVKTNKKIGKIPEESNIIYCKLSGIIEDIEYKHENIFVIKFKEELIIINKKHKNTILKTNINICEKLILDDVTILNFNDVILTFNISKKNIEILCLDKLMDINRMDIGYTSKKVPFFIHIDSTSFHLKKSQNKSFISINNTDIKDLLVNNTTNTYNENFTELEIRFKDQKVFINLKKEIIATLIKDVFIYSKKPMINNASIQELYFNWAKSMNDMILFNFFGNLYYMKMEIDNILKKEITDEDRITIVNMLYYQIQEQRNQFDIISAYMPKAMEQGEIKLFNQFKVRIDRKVFRVFQKQLFSMASQINRHLADIEKSLNHLSFIIYSDFNTRDFSKKLKTAELGLGVAAAVVFGGMPMLAMKAVNMYTSNKMDKKMQEVELNKLQVFSNQAISKLNHLIDTMYPYYISESNDTLFELFRVLSKEYEKHKDVEVKDILFNRIADIYVSKQMTLNDMTNIRKKDLIDSLYTTINSSINTFDSSVFLIGGIE